MAFIYCKKCGDINYLTSEELGSLTDFGAKCEKCETINTITLKMGELKKQE
jgi:phage FluMu protein Com